MLILSARRVWVLVALFALITATGSVAAWQVARPESSGTAIDLIAQPEEEDDGGAVCPPGEADCEVTDEDETGGGGDGDGNGGSDTGGGGGGACYYVVNDVIAASLAAAQTRYEVPCYQGGGVGWYDGESCYYGDFPDIRDATGGIPEPPEGKTEEDGRYYYLRCIANAQVFNGELNFTLQTVEQWVWVDFEDVPTITPEQVFQDWYAGITLDPVQPRLAPPAGTSGLVGLPVWLGLEPNGNSLGPIDDQHCIEGVCVTIAGVVTTVDWTMGDGGSVSCVPGQHTVWQRGTHDFLVPGNYCHHYYQQTSRDRAGGQYEITATSNWVVNWSADASEAGGTETTDRSATVSLQIDEIQVLTGR